MTLAHRPLRPCWVCGDCGQPWPCAALRWSLYEEAGGDRVYLSIYLGLHHAQAFADGCPGDLYDQFIGWIHDPRRHGRPAEHEGASLWQCKPS